MKTLTSWLGVLAWLGAALALSPLFAGHLSEAVVVPVLWAVVGPLAWAVTRSRVSVGPLIGLLYLSLRLTAVAWSGPGLAALAALALVVALAWRTVVVR
ncbi:hypothetical protein ACIBH1_45690 [Nonomuraea sp. NPDC050663]|uniref:hypothetical protein n=1 Tax=Nonomuraea sp. NPDC050663 TaxID=3364370 RepID=UPI00379ECEF6